MLFYYRCAVDLTVLHALSSIVSTKKHGAKDTLDATTYLLNYLTIHLDNVLHYCDSGMVLFVHLDASYLTKLEGRLQVGSHFVP